MGLATDWTTRFHTGPIVSCTLVEVANPSLPLAVQLSTYYRSKCRFGEIPTRVGIDPSEMIPLLPYLFLMEPAEDGKDWRYRLYGTQLVDRVGSELTGRKLSEALCPQGAAETIAINNEIARNGCARIFKGRMFGDPDVESFVETVKVPIRSRDGSSVWILGGLFFKDIFHMRGHVPYPMRAC